MRFYLLTLCLIFSISNLNAQKDFFKNGSVDRKHYADTLSVEYHNTSIVVKATINNKPSRLFLDTGSPTVIGNDAKGHFKIIAEQEIEDAAHNTETVQFATIPKITIGHTDFLNTTTTIYDMNSALEHHNVDGILGANTMAKAVWDFDMKNKRIIITDKVNKDVVKSAYKTKITLLPSGSPLATVTHFDQVEEAIYIDFGYNGLYSFSNNVFSIVKENKMTKSYIQGEGELFETAFGKQDTIFSQVILRPKIGNLQLPKLLADVDYDDESSIGCEILDYYRVVLDFRKKHMYFIPYGNDIPSKFQTYGITLDTNPDNLYVSFVWFPSKAYKKGVRTHDKILSVNGINTQNTKELSEDTKSKVMSFFDSDKPIRIEINTPSNFIELTKETLLE